MNLKSFIYKEEIQMKIVNNFWTGKRKLKENHPLTKEEGEAILFVLTEVDETLVPTPREVEAYTEAIQTLEHFNNRNQQESLYSYFEPVVKQFEKKYEKILRVA